jgi:hypothetical protein
MKAMRLLGLAMGALLILVSAISFAAPHLRLSLERSVMTQTGLYAIAALRIAIGLGSCSSRQHRGHRERSAYSA